MNWVYAIGGFDKKRLFYTQGDYGLFQSSSPGKAARNKTYDNYEVIRRMVLSEGFQIRENGELIIPENTEIRMTVPSDLVPVCPDDGEWMTTNLRCDDSFVEDEGWHQAALRYQDFLRRHERLRVLYLELGVGMNTPVFRLLRTAGKSRKHGKKQQIQLYSYNNRQQIITRE